MKRFAALMMCAALSACDQGHPPPKSNFGANPALPDRKSVV